MMKITDGVSVGIIIIVITILVINLLLYTYYRETR